MDNIVNRYPKEVMLFIEKSLSEALTSMGVSMEDIKRNPNRFQHIIFPDGREEWRYDGVRLLWSEPLKAPSLGLMFYGVRM